MCGIALVFGPSKLPFELREEKNKFVSQAISRPSVPFIDKLTYSDYTLYISIENVT